MGLVDGIVGVWVGTDLKVLLDLQLGELLVLAHSRTDQAARQQQHGEGADADSHQRHVQPVEYVDAYGVLEQVDVLAHGQAVQPRV